MNFKNDYERLAFYEAKMKYYGAKLNIIEGGTIETQNELNKIILEKEAVIKEHETKIKTIKATRDKEIADIQPIITKLREELAELRKTLNSDITETKRIEKAKQKAAAAQEKVDKLLSQTTPVPNPVVSTPVPNPVVSTPVPNSVVSAPVPNPVVSTPVPNPVVSTPVPNPVVSTPVPKSKSGWF